MSIFKFRRDASEDSGASGVRAPFWPRKHRRVVRNRNSGSLGTPSAFGRSVCACLEPLGPPKMPSGSLWSPKGARNCLRKCLQCRFGAPNALEGLAPEPPVHSKRLLVQAPKLPGRSKSLSEPAPQPHCFQITVRKYCSKLLFEVTCLCNAVLTPTLRRSACKVYGMHAITRVYLYIHVYIRRPLGPGAV